jgi:hypothetical protein
MWIFSALIVLAALMIFLGTLTIVPGLSDQTQDAWIKVKLKINSQLAASWCRVTPGKGVKYYTLEGEIIDQSKDRVSIVEPCLNSNTAHPIPHDEVMELADGYIGAGWIIKSNPFNHL